MMIRFSSVGAMLLLLSLGLAADAAPAAKTLLAKAPPVKLEAVTSSLPIWFEPNRGQVGGRTDWTTRAAGAWLFLTSNEVVYALPPEIRFDPAKTRGVPSAKTTNVHMRIVGGRRVKGVGEEPMGSYSNYFVGKHEDEWFTGVPHFERVRYPEVYPGIDLVYYATGRSVEYDFLVEPGADPAAIELAFDGVDGVRVDGSGDLVVSAGGKSFRQHRPRVFQGGEEIEASYRMTERGTVKVEVGEFNPLVSLRVDPVLDFATYLGGPGEDSFYDIAISSDGNPVLAGSTQSPASPALDPFQQPSVVSMAPIVLKMSADGQRVVFYSILGRGGWDMGYGVALDSTDRVVISGATRSANFPLQNAFQSEFRAIWDNAFIARLSANGRSLVHSSYMGGSNLDYLRSLAIDEAGAVYAVGASFSSDFPLQQAVQSSFGGSSDAVLAKVGPEGSLLLSTYWGGPGGETFADVVWRKDGMLFAAGTATNDEFPLKEAIFRQPTARTGWPNATIVALDTTVNSIRMSSYLGDGLAAAPTGIALDSAGRVHVAGWIVDRHTRLKNPLFSQTVDGVWNGFLIALRSDGKDILWSTVLPALDARSVAVDMTGSIHVSGIARLGFPAKDSFHQFKGGGVLNGDHGIIKIAPGGTSLVYATLLGGTGNEMESALAAGQSGTIYFVGKTGSRDYPVRTAYQRETGGSIDGVFARITDNTVTQTPPFRVSPSSFSLRYVQGDRPPPPLDVSVTNLMEPLAIQTDVDWLRASPGRLSANGIVQIVLELSRLGPGIHRGSVRIGTFAVDISVTVFSVAPLLINADPAVLATGSGDTEITLHGRGFTAQTTVYVEGTPWLVSPVRFVNESTIRFTIPKAYLSGEYNFALSVQNPSSAVSNSISLAVGRPAPSIAPGGIVSAASFTGQAFSPGELVTIFGENFEFGMRVTFDGIPADPFYLSPNQLSVTVPYAVAGAREVPVIVQQSADRKSAPVRMVVWPARPGLFTVNSSGKGQGAILNQDGSVNSTSNPASKGSIVVLYGTGGGQLAGALLELPVKVFIDGIQSEVLYAGVAPGLIPGVVQVNVRVPEFASMGEVALQIGERESQPGVTISLRQ